MATHSWPHEIFHHLIVPKLTTAWSHHNLLLNTNHTQGGPRWIWARQGPYRVSHSKVNKVILRCWGYRFWFLLVFWILRFHEVWPFMFQSSVFIELIFCAIYGQKCKHANKMFGESSLNIPFVKLFSIFFSTFFEFFDAFLFWAFS